MKASHGILISALILPVSLAAGELTPEEAKFFEEKIRPVLADSCYQCHSAKEKVRGGLTLDTREGLLAGGDTGPAIVAGDPEASLLWTAINWADDDYEMPPKKKLPASIIADFGKWIEMGAPDPRVTETTVVRSEIDIEAGKKFWSFQKPAKPQLPTVRDTAWPIADADAFVLAKLEESGLKPAGVAPPETLLRRLSFDLVGLPPSMPEIETFAKAWKHDPDKAYREKVDELLASEQFGERWGRHWLDVARYAESSGKDINMTFPHAWRYRDYVIDAFNQDKPYDRFLKEQIAGDLLPIRDDAEWQENLIATGFLAIGPKGLNEQNPRQFAIDLADEQIDATTQAMLGLTVSCARCHDHKTDPIPTADYYALAGIFQSTKTYFGTVNAVASRRATKLLELPVADASPIRLMSERERDILQARLQDSERELRELQTAARRDRQAGTNNLQNLIRLRTTIAQLQARLNSVDENGVAKTFAMGTQDYDRPTDATVLLRGELDKPAQKVPRGFLQVVHHPETPEVASAKGSGRLELAQWIASEENPLTARVMVNRIWSKLFGQGIVASPNNFGATGKAPTHPELLDFLAVRFVEEGWSVKTLIRELVGSRAYRMASDFHPAAYALDPDNTLLWRMSPRQLEAESLRDALLVASGELDESRPRGSIVTSIGDAAIGRRVGGEQLNRPVMYRSVYLPAVRDSLPESLALFDGADSNIVAGSREETNVPGQALYLMNNSFVIQRSEALAKRLDAEAMTPREKIGQAFLICFGRVARPEEMESSLEFFRRFESYADGGEDDLLAWSTFCQSLFASAEFRYLN